VNLVDGGMVLVLGQDAGVLPTIVRGSSGTALGIDLVCGCVCGHLRGDRQSCGHLLVQVLVQDRQH
jgi:hypothetical protein